MAVSDATGAAVDALFREFRRTGRRAIRNQLVTEHQALAGRIATDYRDRGVEYDDLRQVAMVGLVKAVERFDPERGVPFTAFASRTINGELKRYFRDKTWGVRPPRGLQEVARRIPAAIDDLTHNMGRPPKVDELARYLDVSQDEVLEAMEARGAYRSRSIDAPVDADGGRTVGDLMGSIDPAHAQTEAAVAVQQLLERLPEREAEIIRLRFFEDLTQDQIAERVGISQMHVSRLIRRSLRDLRAFAGDDT